MKTSGKKFWRFRYNDRQQSSGMIGLGVFSALSLADARAKSGLLCLIRQRNRPTNPG
ncbi:Arm DNA-binding domain-containing protein [Cronobacter dublinensis]|uniref:Arm DNA-binding domain-containing protein n=1 Tax=Cronobacter dublinensis TaxID=413497 RepID=UPI003D15A641